MNDEKSERRRRIGLFLDGECDSEEREAVERRIESDPVWKSDYILLDTIRAEIASLRIEASEIEHEELLRAADRVRSRKRRWPLWAVGVAAAAAMVWFIARPSIDDRQPAPPAVGGEVNHYYQIHGGREGELVSLHIMRPY